MTEIVKKLRANLGAVIKGKPREIDFLITALVGSGNVLAALRYSPFAGT